MHQIRNVKLRELEHQLADLLGGVHVQAGAFENQAALSEGQLCPDTDEILIRSAAMQLGAKLTEASAVRLDAWRARNNG